MPGFLANSSLTDFEALALPIIVGTDNTTPASTSISSAAMTHSET